MRESEHEAHSIEARSSANSPPRSSAHSFHSAKASEIQTREDSQSRMNVTNSIASPRYVRSIDRFEELAVGSPLSPPFAVRRRGGKLIHY